MATKDKLGVKKPAHAERDGPTLVQLRVYSKQMIKSDTNWVHLTRIDQPEFVEEKFSVMQWVKISRSCPRARASSVLLLNWLNATVAFHLGRRREPPAETGLRERRNYLSNSSLRGLKFISVLRIPVQPSYFFLPLNRLRWEWLSLVFNTPVLKEHPCNWLIDCIPSSVRLSNPSVSIAKLGILTKDFVLWCFFLLEGGGRMYVDRITDKKRERTALC